MNIQGAKRCVARQFGRSDAIGTLFRSAALAINIIGVGVAANGFYQSSVVFFSKPTDPTLVTISMFGMLGSLVAIEKFVDACSYLNGKSRIASALKDLDKHLKTSLG